MLGSAWRTRIAAQTDLRNIIKRQIRNGQHERTFACSTSRGGSRIESIYVDTTPPTTAQKNAAAAFFANHLPIKSWTAEEWRSQPHSDPTFLVPEVAFLGRSNSGKSSLLNALLQQQGLCRVGAKPGKTKTMHAWSLGPRDPTTGGARRGFQGDLEPKLNVMDMPGYGFGSRADWGDSIMKYLVARRQLRRAFVLVNPAHGLKTGDLQMLELLQSKGIPYQIIATKCDHDSVKRLPELLANLQRDIRSALENNNATAMLAIIDDILATGGLGDGKMNDKVDTKAMSGLDDVRWAILRATGLEQYALTAEYDENAQALPAGSRAQGSGIVHPALLHSTARSAAKPKAKDKQKAKEKHAKALSGQKSNESKTQNPVNDAQFPWFQTTANSNVGHGIDDLLAMTTSKSRSAKQHGFHGSEASNPRAGGRVRPHVRR